MYNCVQAVSAVLKHLKVKFNSEYVEDTILSHPEPPSLISISETLEKYNIETLAIKIDAAKLSGLPMPVIVQEKEQKQPLFHVIEHIDAKVVSYYNEMIQKF
jgi:ABC-type bacteriocin/lantibiotic exporter with double-glycine peptidase domain